MSSKCRSLYSPFHSLNGSGGNSSNNTTVGERLLSTLLTEMDGLEEAKVSTNLMHLLVFFP